MVTNMFQVPNENENNVVVSGMSGKFPNSRTAQDYTDNLLNKVNLCTEDNRRGEINNPEIPKVAGILWDFQKFDAGNFGVHPFQAIYADPMGRMFLEEVCQAIFDAGIHPDELRGTRTGVFVGACLAEYELQLYEHLPPNAYGILGCTRSMIAQRVSYSLQLNGPAFNLDTACSSGMYALEAAYASIQEDRCDRAIVGGVNLTLEPLGTLQFARLGVLNDGSGCRPFDHHASGYTRSEAIVALVLQKHQEAKRIYARVVHVKTNSDGFKPQGITFPSFEGQTLVLRDVYSEGKVNPRDVGFMEAHGTGTKVGDPEELTVIDKFFQPTVEMPLLIGSVKGNIGHTEPAAGLCSAVKVLHALNSNEIPPNIHFNTPRKGISALEEHRFKVVTDVTPFPANKKYAAINSFGFGGANVHAVLEKYCNKSGQTLHPVMARLVCYSGRTQEALNIIHESIVYCKDLEYLALLQEAFKANINTHLYRGYTIVGKNIRSSSRASYNSTNEIMVIMGQFNSKTCLENLSTIPMIRDVIKQKDQSEIVSVHQMILTILRKLGLRLAPFKEGSQTTYSFKRTVVILGNKNHSKRLAQKYNLVTFNDNFNQNTFLSNIGDLYNFGFQPQVQLINSLINFPVSSGTKQLSHLLKWKHKIGVQKKWAVVPSVRMEESRIINTIHKQHAFYSGHVIDGRNLFPATGYLYLVWDMYANIKKQYAENLDIIFENVQFIRASTLSNSPLKLYINIQSSGLFNVSEKNCTVVTGIIKLCTNEEDKNLEFITAEQETFHSTLSYVLSTTDTYRELRLRGYNYSGMFRAINAVTPTIASIKWENNWVTFLDNMMQVCILKQNTRSLYVPVGIDRLTIRSKCHIEHMNIKNDKLVTVRLFENSKTIKSKFIEMRGLNAKSIPRKKEKLQPVLEKYVFVPNENIDTSIATSIRINIQLMLECKFFPTFKMSEIASERDTINSLIIPEICNVIQDLPVVLPEMYIVSSEGNLEVPNCKSEKLLPEQNLLLVCKNPDDKLLNEVEKNLISDGFLLSFCTEDQLFPASYNVLTKHRLKSVNVEQTGEIQYSFAYFLRKSKPAIPEKNIMDVSHMEVNSWLHLVQDAIKSNSEVILIAEKNTNHGILGFINCLNKEPGCEKVTCVHNQDKSMHFGNKNNENMQKQLEKHLKINVYKNGQWGTYRHLLLENTDKMPAYHWYATALNRGDLSTLNWIQGSIRPDQVVTVKIMYSALNFRDLMLASGKLSPEAITRDRMRQSRQQGFEYVGYANNGTPVMCAGMGGISNFAENCFLKIPIPKHWDMEDAATILIVYSTVMYGLIHKGNLQKGQSILIHSATGGVGLAALNVCSHFKCDIFVTVGTREKRDYIKKHYPHIKQNHIGNSRNTSFKEMIMRETKRNGVDFVINSLAEDKLKASVQCLAKKGSFVEIGKYDLDRNSQLFLDLSLRDCQYIGVMLDAAMTQESCTKTLEELWTVGFREGYIKPLPRTIFQMHELDKAFKYLSTGKHIGKVLIRIDHNVNQLVLPRYHCNPNKTYIVFGGLGGFGLELADWLVMRGAKYIVLVSRSGVTTGYQRYRIEFWRSCGVNISILTENVTDYDVCHKALERIEAKTPIDGIFNLAVVLKDAMFEQQTIESMITSMKPKAILTENLDKITRQICSDLGTFVVFSSVSCGRGNAGQTNYGYSNSIMERICENRHDAGLPAVAVQWGAVGDVGLLEALQKEHNEIAIGGTLQQKVTNCLNVLDKLLLQSNPIVSSIVVAEKFARQSPDSPTESVCQIMGINDIKAISLNATFPELGMDSMIAVEIKQTLERDFDIILSPNELRNLTFAKLDEIIEKGSTHSTANIATDIFKLAMLIPGVQLAMKRDKIIDINENKSRHMGDFILAFPGLDADIRCFENVAKKLQVPIKVVSYDSITREQQNVAVIVDYLFETLKNEIKAFNSFKFLAHSIGCLAAIELIKRFEAINIAGTLILIDGAPELMFQLFDLLRGKDQNELESIIIEGCVQTTLPQLNIVGLKEDVLKVKGYKERVKLCLTKYVKVIDDTLFQQLELLMQNVYSRLMSVPEYKARSQNFKLQSKVILYKPSIPTIKNVPNNYNLHLICEKVCKVKTFDGTHISVAFNDNMHQQIFVDFEFFI